MNTCTVQWLTTDRTLFELDWLSYLLDNREIAISSDVKNLSIGKKVVLILNRHLPYHSYINQLRLNQASYGIILLSDENLTEPFEYVHDPACKFVFRNYVHPWYYQNPKVYTFGLGYKVGFKNKLKTIKKTENRKYMWSFLGTPHTNRKEALAHFEDIIPHKIHLTNGFGAENQVSIEEYSETLNNSVFALCPLGQSSADNFRIYEALEAGCIPITLDNSSQFAVYPNYWAAVFGDLDIPFIHAGDWKSAVILVKSVIQENKLNEVQNKCINFWETHKQTWKNQMHECIKNL